MTDDLMIDRLLAREGGYVDHAADRAGPTHYGITLDTLRWARNRDVTAEDVRQLTREEAREIYRRRYLQNPGLMYLPAGHRLRELVFDAAVHHGIRRAVCWLQTALGVRADGHVGPQTRRALEAADLDRVYRDVLRQRFIFIGQILTASPSQAVFAHGWIRRLAEFV